MQDRISTPNLDRDENLLTEFASKDELADIFGVSTRTIERWVRYREIPKPVRFGALILFHLPTIRALMVDKARKEAERLSEGRRRAPKGKR